MKNRIKEHRTVRASDLVPHEMNPRTHSPSQRAALQALYEEIGFARSLLAYETSDGSLKLIDGHLRASTTPDEMVTVEILDVTDDEARALILAIDPLAQLADYDAQALASLQDAVNADAVNNLWSLIEESGQAVAESLNETKDPVTSDIEETYQVLVDCNNEKEQIALLRRLKKEGFKCKALMT